VEEKDYQHLTSSRTDWGEVKLEERTWQKQEEAILRLAWGRLNNFRVRYIQEK